MVLPLQWHFSLRLPKNRQSVILRGLLGYKKRWEVHEIREGTDWNQRRRLILRHFLPSWRRNHPNRPLQLHRDHYRKQTSWPGGYGLRHVQDPHHRLLWELLLYVAIQESNFEADNVRGLLPGWIPKNGSIDLLVYRWQTRRQPSIWHGSVRQHPLVIGHHLRRSSYWTALDCW